MSDPHHHADPIEESLDSNPVQVAIGVAVGAVALVIGIILLVQFAVGSYASRSLKGDKSMSKQAVAMRLAPVAQLAIDPNAPVGGSAPAADSPPSSPLKVAVATAPTTVPAAAPAKPAPAAGGNGKATYDSVCTVCHGAGVAGAPKFGDKAAWAPRIKTGIETLHGSALKGKGAMPPKGGNPSLADADVKAAVDYMVAAAK